jgi:hypothetical protein
VSERTLILKLNGGTDELSGRVRDNRRRRGTTHRLPLAVGRVGAAPIGLAAHIRPEPPPVRRLRADNEPRVFLRRLWGGRIAYRSWAIAAEPNRFTAEQWRQLGVDVLEAAADSSLEELRRRLAEEPFAEPAA